jgi:uracil-DNA glycosylase
MGLDPLVSRIRKCTLCEHDLPLGANPVFQARSTARILIAAQAPGIRVHETGIPFNDPSGDRLREWMGIDQDVFYDARRIAIVPMGFCFPGTGKNGDLPPRPECAATWRKPLLAELKKIELTLVIGQYAHRYHLGKQQQKSLTETVRHWKDYAPEIMPLPHPSPRNNIWLKKNPWFEQQLVPELRKTVAFFL